MHVVQLFNRSGAHPSGYHAFGRSLQDICGWCIMCTKQEFLHGCLHHDAEGPVVAYDHLDDHLPPMKWVPLPLVTLGEGINDHTCQWLCCTIWLMGPSDAMTPSQVLDNVAGRVLDVLPTCLM